MAFSIFTLIKGLYPSAKATLNLKKFIRISYVSLPSAASSASSSFTASSHTRIHITYIQMQSTPAVTAFECSALQLQLIGFCTYNKLTVVATDVHRVRMYSCLVCLSKSELHIVNIYPPVSTHTYILKYINEL